MDEIKVNLSLATRDDDAAVEKLLARVLLGGKYQFQHAYKQGYLESTKILAQNPQNMIGRIDSELILLGLRALRPSYFNGEIISCGYLGNLHLAPEYRGRGVLRALIGYLKQLHHENPGYVYIALSRAKNVIKTMDRIGVPPNNVDLGKILSCYIYINKKVSEKDFNGDIVKCNHIDLPKLVKKLNENRMQFANVYCEDDFLCGRFKNYNIANSYFLYRYGKLTAVMGVWDLNDLRQVSVNKYPLITQLCRPLYNLISPVPLPQPKIPISILYLVFISNDTVEDFDILFRRVYNDFVDINKYKYLIVSLHEKDPRVKIVEKYPVNFIPYHFFYASYGELPKIDEAVPYIEAPFII